MPRNNEILKTFVGLKCTTNHLNQVVKRDVQQHGLNVNEFSVLELLFHKGSQQVQTIKEKILVANSSTTYIIDKLCQKNLVERIVDAQDKRICYVSLTAQGQQLMEQIFPNHVAVIAAQFDALTDDEVVLLKQLLKKMNHL